MCSRRSISAALVVAAVAWGGVAAADVSRSVIAAFKGELVITKGDLPEGKNDKDTIAKIKAERLKELTGEAKGDVTGSSIDYTALLDEAGAAELTMEFCKDKKLAANKRIAAFDPKLQVLSGEL